MNIYTKIREQAFWRRCRGIRTDTNFYFRKVLQNLCFLIYLLRKIQKYLLSLFNFYFPYLHTTCPFNFAFFLPFNFLYGQAYGQQAAHLAAVFVFLSFFLSFNPFFLFSYYRTGTTDQKSNLEAQNQGRILFSPISTNGSRRRTWDATLG